MSALHALGLDGWLGEMQAVTLVALLLALLALAIFARLHPRTRRGLHDVHVLPDEAELARVELPVLLGRACVACTDQRVVQRVVRWPFSATSVRTLFLADAHDVRWFHGLNLLAVLLAIPMLTIWRPGAVALVMIGVGLPIAALAVPSAFSRSPFGGIRLVTAGHASITRLHRFLWVVEGAWLRGQQHRLGLRPAATPSMPVAPVSSLASWGAVTWILVGAMMAVAWVQKIVSGHVSFDHLALSPLLIGLPLAAARRSAADAAFTSAFGFAGTLAVKFPNALASDGHPFVVQALIVGAGITLLAIAGAWLNERFFDGLAVVPALAWPLLASVASGSSLSDPRPWVVAIVAAGVALIVPVRPWEGVATLDPVRAS